MIVAHVNGVPLEETVLQLAPFAAAMLTVAAVGLRATLGRIRRRTRSHAGDAEL